MSNNGNEFVFKPAVKEKLKARVALVGPTGSGKTFSMLRIARGIAGQSGKIGVIDTEYGKSRLYAKSPKNPDGVTEFEVVDLRPPYTPDRYMAALIAAARAGFDVVGVDSLSHAWMGQGGILDQVDRAAASAAQQRGRGRQDNFSAWRDVTPMHNALVDALLAHPCHLIVCMRAKQAYEITEVEGRKKIEKLGLQAIQRDGIDYEFDVVADVSIDHTLSFSKTRCAALDGQVIRRPGEDLGATIGAWLDDGAERPPERLADCATVDHVLGWCADQKVRIGRKDEKAQAATREAIEAAAERVGADVGEALRRAGLRT